jgi:hypothetical protein
MRIVKLILVIDIKQLNFAAKNANYIIEEISLSQSRSQKSRKYQFYRMFTNQNVMINKK